MDNQYPTVGMGVDLSGLKRGQKELDAFELSLDKLPGKAAAAGKAISDNLNKTTSANQKAAKSEADRASEAEKASAKEVKAAQRAMREKQQIRYRIRQINAAMNAAEVAEDAAARAREVGNAMKAAKDQERIERQALDFRRRMWAQRGAEERAVLARSLAEEKRAADAASKVTREASRQAEKDRRYLMRVRLQSAKMEEDAAKAAAREEARRASASRTVTGGRQGAAVTASDLNLVSRFTGALGTLRNGLGDTRSLIFDLRTAVGVFLGGLVIKPIIDAADAMTALESRTRLYAARASDVPYIFEQVYQTAKNARVGLEGVATLYTRLAPLGAQLGKSQSQLLQTVESVSKAFSIGGASAQEATAAAQQFAQALSSNRFGGDELRSVAENAPVLLQVIAEGVNKINPALNLNAATFIKWAQAGNANAEIVVKAIDASREKIDAMFKQFPVTISQATTLVGNSFKKMIADIDKATGASTAVAGFITQFATFLESKQTVDTLAGAVKALGAIAGGTFAAIKAIGDYLPTIITLMAALAGAAGIQAVIRALVTMQYAFALAGTRMTAYTVATGLATTATRGLMTAIGGLAGLMTGGIILVITAVAAAFNALANAQKAATNSSANVQNATVQTASAIERASLFVRTYGGDTQKLDQIQKGVIETADKRVKAEAGVISAAQNRLNLEKLMAKAALTTASADATAAAAAARRQASMLGIAAMLSAADGPRGQRKKLLEQQKTLNDAAKTYTDLAQASQKAIGEVDKLKATATAPEGILPKGLGTTEKDLKGMDGAINRIATMQAEVLGLEAIFGNLTSNPLSALSEQIKAAGDEEAARYTSGKAAKAGFAEKARALGQDKERLKILIDLKRGHLEAAAAAEVQSRSDTLAAQGQLSSQRTLQEFWGQSERTLEDYFRALTAAREQVTEAAVETSNFSIAQRYGAKSLDDISSALERNGVAYGDRAKSIEDAAKREADAVATSLRRQAKNEAGISKNDDTSFFNKKMADEAIDAFDMIDRAGRSLADSLSSAFGTVGDAFGNLLSVMNDYSRQQMNAMARIQAARDEYGENSERALLVEKRETEDLALARRKSYGDMAAAAKGFFKSGTVGYKTLGAAEKAFRLYEFAMSAKAVVVKAAEVAAKVGLFGTQAAAAAQAGAAEMFASLGPLGFAAVAAMVAVLAGFGFKGGRGGGAPSIPISETRQAAQGSGSVLGDPEAKSESIARSLEMIEDLMDTELSYSGEMVRALRSIESGIGAVAGLISRQLGVGGTFSTSGLGLGTASSRGGISGALAGGAAGGAIGYGIGAAATAATGALMSGFSGVATALAGPVGIAVAAVGALVGALTKTKTTTELLDQGLVFANSSLDSILNGGLSGQSYQDIKTTSKKSIFGIGLGSKTNTSTISGQLDADIAKQLTLVIGGLRDSVLASATALGITGAEEVLKSFEVSLGRISFKDMSGEEIQAALDAIFGKLGDQLAEQVVPAVESFQRAGEGAFETLVRLASEYKGVDAALGLIGKEFTKVGVESLQARTYLVEMAGGLDALSSQAQFFAQNFLSEAEQLAPLQKQLNSALSALGVSSSMTRDEFKNLVLAQDVSTQAGADMYNALMRIAPAFDTVADAAEKAREAEEARQKQISDRKAEIQSDIDELTMTPEQLTAAGREKELAVANALDSSVADLLVKYWILKDATDANAKAAALAAEAMEKAKANQITNLGYMRQLMEMDDAVLGTTSAVDAARADELEKLDDTGKMLAKIVWARQDEEKVLAKQVEIRKQDAEILRLQGNSVEATMIERELELAAMDAGLRPRQVMIWQLEDLNEANEKAAALLVKRVSLEQELLEALGRPDDAKALARAQALKDLDPSLHGMQNAVWNLTDANEAFEKATSDVKEAQDALNAAYERQRDTIQQTIDKIEGQISALKDFWRELQTGPIAGNNIGIQYSKTKADFERVAGLAAQGNEQALGDLRGVSEAFLDASIKAQSTNLQYFKDLSAVKIAVKAAEKYQEDQLLVAKAEMAALEAQVAGLIMVNASVLSVRDAISGLSAAINAQAAAQAAKNAATAAAEIERQRQQQAAQQQQQQTSRPVAINDNDSADLKTAKAIYLSATGGLASDVYNRYVGNKPFEAMNRVGYEGDPEALRAKWKFADGGAFRNGVVTEPHYFNIGEMGEGGKSEAIMPLVNTSDGLGVRAVVGNDNSELTEIVQAMREELNAGLLAVAKNTSSVDRTTKSWDRNGVPVVNANPEVPLSVKEAV